MNIFNKIFFIVVSIQLSQCSNHYYKYVDDEINENNNDQFTWLVVIRDRNDESMYKLSYGSLIQLQAVLTSAQGIRRHAAGNLIVETNCQLTSKIADNEIPYLINCKSRDVKKIIYQNTHNRNSRTKYAILILKKRFNITDKVSFINVAMNLNDINKENCFIPRWMRLHKNSSGHKRLVTVLYHKSFSNEHLNRKYLNPNQFKYDRDYIIGKEFHELTDDNTTFSYEYDGNEIGVNTNRLNFLGSPFVCQLKRSAAYVQVGIATFRFTINTFIFLTGSYNIHQNGSLFTIYQFQNEIMKTIYENLQVCKNVCQEYCSYDFD